MQTLVHHHCKESLSSLSMEHRLRFDVTLVFIITSRDHFLKKRTLGMPSSSTEDA